MHRHIYLVFLLAILVLPATHPAQAQDAPGNTDRKVNNTQLPDCDYCKEKLLTLDALRSSLPDDWMLQMEREPVFNGDVLTVQAGMEHPQTLLLVHGLGQNGFTDWLTVMPQLAQRYHVLTLDFPGFGYSSSPSGKYSPRNYARVLQWLIKRHGKGEVIVVGHSMGGAVSLRFASEYPALLSKLVLVDAAGILQRTAFVKHTASLPLSVDGVPSFLKNAVARVNDWGNNAVEKITGLPDPTRAISSEEPLWGRIMGDNANLNAGMAMAEEDFSAAIYSVKIPTQIIWGDKDPIAPLRTGQMLARRLSKAQLHILSGAGHTPMEDPGSAAFLDQLNNVLDNPPQPASYSPPTSASKVDLSCKGKVDKTYSGNYREVRIEGCSAIRLRNLSAEHIVMRDSIVEMINVQIQSKGAALEINNSELVATAGEIGGEPAIRVNDSRIDLAGFKISSESHAVEVLKSSLLIGSANQINSPGYSGYWQSSKRINDAFLKP